MKLKKIVTTISAIFLTTSICAKENIKEEAIKNIVKAEKINSDFLSTTDQNIQTILKQETFAKRYILLKGYLKQKPNLVIKVKESEEKYYEIPLVSYLLIEGYEKEAIKIIEEELAETFTLFEFKGNQYSDLLIALLNNQKDYFSKAVNKNPEKINKQFNFNGEEGYYLLMAVAQKKDLRTNYYTEILLKNGANPYLQSKNNHTAEMLASYENNTYFLESLHEFQNKVEKRDTMINVPLPYKEKLKQDKIIENLNKGLLKELSNNIEELRNKWITLIILGYNEAAELLYSELVKNKNFNINDVNNKNINALMATAMSAIPGGNVEYAIKLINRGININYEHKDTRAIHIAISKDAYKVLIQLIQNGVNFIKDKNGDYFFNIAMERKAQKSAYIIKEASKIIAEQKK